MGSEMNSVLERHDWSLEEIEALLQLPLVDLLWHAQQVHREAHPGGYHVQLASLLSVKTGGCEEDCEADRMVAALSRRVCTMAALPQSKVPWVCAICGSSSSDSVSSKFIVVVTRRWRGEWVE